MIKNVAISILVPILVGILIGVVSTIGAMWIWREYFEPKPYLRIGSQTQELSPGLFSITLTLESLGKAPIQYIFLDVRTEGIIENVLKGGTADIRTWGGAIGNFIEITAKDVRPGERAYVSLRVMGSDKIEISRIDTDSEYDLVSLSVKVGPEETLPSPR